MKVKVTKLGFYDGLLPSPDELRALKRLKEIVSLLLDERERSFDDSDELRAVRRIKDIICLLLDKGEWTMSLEKPPVDEDERRTSFWNIAREANAGKEDRLHWAELRSLWTQLKDVKSSLTPFRALPQLGESIVRGEIHRRDYSSLECAWRPEYDEPEALHSRIQDALQKAETDPVEFEFPRWWIFKNNRYSIEGHYTNEEKKLLILEEFDKERKHFERLHHKHRSGGSGPARLDRPRIPETVRIEVWRRDGGRCSRCESRENLEYDHIVPLAKGGSNTARNVELLCEKCNRSKADKIE